MRARAAVDLDHTRTKHCLAMFLLRHGYPNSETQWTERHLQWIKGLGFTLPALEETYDGYLETLLSQNGKLSALDARIEELATSARDADTVPKLRCLIEIDYLTAARLTCEVGDSRRFVEAEQFMSFLGAVPGALNMREFSFRLVPGGTTRKKEGE